MQANQAVPENSSPSVTDSILTSVKKMLGIEEEYTHFDPDVLMNINSIFAVLTQIGVGPSDGFVIEDKGAAWSEFLPEKMAKQLAFVKSYMFLRVRLLFDPPQSSAAIDSMTRQANELEWRLRVAADETPEEGGNQNEP